MKRADAPCFKCGTEPRLEGHSVCGRCHRDDGHCSVCYPRISYDHPVRTAGVYRLRSKRA